MKQGFKKKKSKRQQEKDWQSSISIVAAYLSFQVVAKSTNTNMTTIFQEMRLQLVESSFNVTCYYPSTVQDALMKDNIN